jgi:hypothetical protein
VEVGGTNHIETNENIAYLIWLFVDPEMRMFCENEKEL